MQTAQQSIQSFLNALGSNSPAPGGGGASSLSAALGINLAAMVANLTLNKKGYENVQQEISQLLQQAQFLSQRFIELIDEDGQAFLNLMAIYTQKCTTIEEKQQKQIALQEATQKAMNPPFMILKLCGDAIDIHERLKIIGNKNLLSDVATGVTLLKSAMEGAAVNLWINMQNLPSEDDNVIALKKEIDETLNTYRLKSEQIFEEISQCWR